MNTIIIPAIDIMDSRLVRLTKGDYDRVTDYGQDPLEMARRYADCGVTRLHLVDLDGAREKQPRNLAVLEKIADATDLEIEWGGGVKNEAALRSVLDAGASMVICGSVAVEAREEFSRWLERYGSDRIILGADVRDGRVATHGWLKDSDVTVEDLLEEYVPEGLSQLICTDISRDGMLSGPDVDFYAELQKKWDAVDVILSGGVSCIGDVQRAAAAGIRAVIIGKAIYEGRISLEQLENMIVLKFRKCETPCLEML